jgi:Na+-translocating ferredoxin:NAD+ oxidoreductase RnfD subunit
MYPTQLHSYLLWRSSVDPDAQALAKRRFTTAMSLMPAAMVGMFVFGWYAAVIILVSMGTAFVADFICHRFIFTDSLGTRDGTWLLTGLVLALLMPPNVGYWVPIVGAIVAIVVGKYVLSVDNMPLLQPAAIGLLMLFLIGFACGTRNNPILPMASKDKDGTELKEPEPRWPVLTRGIESPNESQDESWSDGTKMRRFISNLVNGFFTGDITQSVSRKDYGDSRWDVSGKPPAQAVHGPRPIDLVKKDSKNVCPNYDWLSLLLGYVPATIGGSSALALGLGILFLIFTGAAHWATPITAMATLFGGLHFVAWAGGPVISENILIHVLTGSTLLFIFYVAADPATAPRSFRGKVYAGVALGLLELLLRLFTPLAEGLFISVVMVQGLSFVIDQWLAPPVEPEVATMTGLSPSSLGRL